MTKKLLWLDLETTGLIPCEHSPIQIAAIYEHGERVETFDRLVNPEGFKIDKEALKINGHKKKKLKTYPTDTLDKFVAFMDCYVDKYDKDDKFTVIGYNVKFDLEMIHCWARKKGFDYMGSYLDWRVVDVLVLARNEWLMGNMPSEPKDFKLGTICEVYGVKVPDHDAAVDIKATRELYHRMMGAL